MLKYEKPTDSFNSFKLFIESSLKKSNNTFDIYFFDNRYTSTFGSDLLNLKEFLPKEHIEMYDSETIKETCTYYKNDSEKLVGLVKFIYNIIY